jgi:phosphocarrier protein HPr
MNKSEDATVTKEVGSVWLAHPAGLHARPAIQLTKLAKRFRANVWVGKSEDGPWVNAKSIARVMGMKMPSKAVLHFSADGDDASHAIRALIKLVENDFTGTTDVGD